jgi:uncharacterized protein YuzE
MRIRIDKASDALYLRLDEADIIESEEVEPGVVLDYDSQGRVVGVEILSLSTRAQPDTLRILQLETM